ncbi:aminoglycoside phosphotransferase family protein [Nocardioides panacis]|uniref:Aminoglycoside phosphotransferase family protein n=1 Tax=Nocardioides panacis TaxID=2849501 RepID=A0A975SZD7_9ACTN|nr:aminoglycoside phosphotransferase family protein [Nocardioides panacis]QWZ08028.1 aminoglycoside phosphotransferase family protein [Nocardioides panacis]
MGELLGECLSDAGAWRLDLLQSKFKPGRKLTAYYRLAPARPSPPTAGEDGVRARHLAVTWSVDRQPAASAMPGTGRPQPPFERLVTASEDGRIVVRICPDDPAMPQLPRLADPGHLAGLVADLCGRRFATRQLTVDTVRYRPGQRHVERVRLDGHPWMYVKTDRDCSGARAVAVATYLRDLVGQHPVHAAVALPLGYVAEDAAALWWNVPGVPLSTRLRAPRADGSVRAVAQAGRVLRVLHESPTGPESLRDRGGPEAVHVEAEETLRAGEHVRALLPDVGPAYEDAVEQVVEELDRMPGEAAVVSHGDFKSDNLVVGDDRLTVLDLDRAAWADPARDLGKLLADLHWWCPDPSAATVLGRSFREGYGACDPARWGRARLWTALFRLRMTARRLPVHDVDWADRARGGVADVVEGLRASRGS